MYTSGLLITKRIYVLGWVDGWVGGGGGGGGVVWCGVVCVCVCVVVMVGGPFTVSGLAGDCPATTCTKARLHVHASSHSCSS